MNNTALLRPCTSDAGPVHGGSFLFDRGSHVPRFHQGLDIAIGVGTPLYASGNGTVISASTTTPGSGRSGGGWIVTISYPVANWDVRVTTMHHSRIDVRPGQTVNAATQIGLSGGEKGADGAGDATGPHVHFEVRVDGVLSNPDSWLNHRDAIAGGPVTPITPPQQEQEDEMKIVTYAGYFVAIDSVNKRYRVIDNTVSTEWNLYNNDRTRGKVFDNLNDALWADLINGNGSAGQGPFTRVW